MQIYKTKTNMENQDKLRITHIMVDEVQVVSRCDGHGTSTSLSYPSVSLVQGLMNVHIRIEYSISVTGWHREILMGQGQLVRCYVLSIIEDKIFIICHI